MAVKVSRTKYGDAKKAVLETVKNTNLQLGVEIASQAKVLSPVDMGQLRNSISASSLTETKLLNNSDGEKAQELDTTGLGDNDVYVGSNSDHAIFQEYGTVRQPAQPFLRPSAELKAKGANMATIATKYSREAMEKEFKGRK